MNQQTANQIWNQATEHLKSVLHPDVFARWIAVIKPLEIKNGTLYLGVHNNFYQTWLEDNYLPLIQNALKVVHSADLSIEFKVASDQCTLPIQEEHEKEPEVSSRNRILREKLAKKQPENHLNPLFTFDEFIVGPSNNFAHAASLAVAQAPARAYNPLFIYGGSGLGKTHLMQAIGHHVLKTSRTSVTYISSEAIMNEYIDALTNKTIVQFRKKYRNTDLLLIDDIHFLAGKNQLQEEFFHTFNALFDAHKQIVMTSDRPAREIIGLEQRLVSRFEWGLVTELEPPDLETRIAILRYKQSQMKVTLPEEVISFIAENIKSNVRSLEGALKTTIAYASLPGNQLSIDKLRHLLRDMLEKEKEVEISFESIQRAVADYYDVRLADMTSKYRQRSIALPRQVAMYLCRRLTSYSLPDIANAFGKTHATILHAFKTVSNRMDVDPSLRSQVIAIAQKMGKTIS